MMTSRQHSVRMMVWGVVILMVAGIGWLLVKSFSHAAFPSTAPSAQVMQSKINTVLSRVDAGRYGHHLFLSEQLDREGDFSTRHAVYVDLFTLHGRVVFWGTGYGSWSLGNAPDIDLTMHGVHGVPSSTGPRAIPRPLAINGSMRPSASARFVAVNYPHHRLIVATSNTGTWAWTETHGVYTPVIGPMQFHGSQ